MCAIKDVKDRQTKPEHPQATRQGRRARPGEKDTRHAWSTPPYSEFRRRHDGRAAFVRVRKDPEKRRFPRFPDA
jgi:hypothetical protein